LPGIDIITWLMLLGPPGMAAPIQAAWSRAMTAMLGDAATTRRLTESGLDPATPITPEATQAFLATEQARFAAIVAAAGGRLSSG
jgi:tripartite-type tricarboxylate transporter receptor subunit TctC